MSSLKHLNKSIKLKRLQGKSCARRCELSLNLLSFTIKKHVKKNPFMTTIAASLTSFLFIRYRTKLRLLYPISSLGIQYLKQAIEQQDKH